MYQLSEKNFNEGLLNISDVTERESLEFPSLAPDARQRRTPVDSLGNIRNATERNIFLFPSLATDVPFSGTPVDSLGNIRNATAFLEFPSLAPDESKLSSADSLGNISSMANMGDAWDLRKRGLKDSLRHDQRVKEAIRKNLRELISEEAIITSDGTKRVRIPLRYLEQYRFKYGQPQQGVGQGQGQPGDVLGRRGQGDGPGDGQAGDQPGEETYEVDVPLEELAKMMLEDLALPWLEEKPDRQIVSESLQYTDLRRKGAMANLAKKPMLLANVKRNAARGDAKVKNIKDVDMRFRTWDIHYEYHTNAAVYLLMDRSGSMTTSKKYIAKSFFFWMVRFLRLKYEHVDTVFIAHDTDAAVVPEKDFFALSNSGGTRCSSAYQVALAHMQEHHPADSYNNYLFHFSDGDNLPYDNAVCKDLVIKLLAMCSNVGYGEIKYKDDADFYGWAGSSSSAFSSLQTKLQEIKKEATAQKHERLVIATISRKEELYQTLQAFLPAKIVAKQP